PLRCTLFPYTTLFRSARARASAALRWSSSTVISAAAVVSWLMCPVPQQDPDLGPQVADVAYGSRHLLLFGRGELVERCREHLRADRKSTRLNSSHVKI